MPTLWLKDFLVRWKWGRDKEVIPASMNICVSRLVPTSGHRSHYYYFLVLKALSIVAQVSATQTSVKIRVMIVFEFFASDRIYTATTKHKPYVFTSR